ncbi:unnamed protein product, partial [Tetraodon nigroviridis]
QAKEQHTGRIIDTLNTCMNLLPRDMLEHVSCIGISGQMHGILFWTSQRGCDWSDGDFFTAKDTSQLITWQDGRCSSDFLSSLPKPDSHLSVATGFGCATIFWYLKHRPEFLEGFTVAGTIQDYVVSMLCGLDGFLNISTSAQLTYAMPAHFKPPDSPQPASPISYFPYFEDAYLAVAASLNGGNVLATFVEMLAAWTKELGADVSEPCLYQKLIHCALDQATSDLQAKEQHTGRIIDTLNTCMNLLPRDMLEHVSCIGISGQMHGILFWTSQRDLSSWRVLRWPGPSRTTWCPCCVGWTDCVPSGGVAGQTRSEWHGVPAGTLVGAALGDFQCSVYSCMSARTDAVLNISTSAQLTYAMPAHFKPPDSPQPASPISYFPYFEDAYLAVAASLNGGNVLATFVEMLAAWTKELGADVSEPCLYQKLIHCALDQATSDLQVSPTILGERHNPLRLGQVTNISPSTLSLGHVTR